MSKPLQVIDCENEKRFFNSQGADYCKICERRFLKLTGAKRCDIFIEGANYTTNSCQSTYVAKGTYLSINMYCIVQNTEKREDNLYNPQTKILRTVTKEGLRDLYKIYK